MQYAYYHLIQTCNCWDCGCFGCFLQLLMSRFPVLKLGFWLFFLRILTIYRMEPSVVSHKKDSYLSRVEHQLFWGQGPSIEFSSLYRFRRQIQYQPTIFADVFGIYMSLFSRSLHCNIVQTLSWPSPCTVALGADAAPCYKTTHIFPADLCVAEYP